MSLVPPPLRSTPALASWGDPARQWLICRPSLPTSKRAEQPQLRRARLTFQEGPCAAGGPVPLSGLCHAGCSGSLTIFQEVHVFLMWLSPAG